MYMYVYMYEMSKCDKSNQIKLTQTINESNCLRGASTTEAGDGREAGAK